jgi:hypothetical protein
VLESSILVEAMIAGNPRSGRTMAACTIALVLALVVSAALIAMRKKTPPTKGIPPLHPSTIFLAAR